MTDDTVKFPLSTVAGMDGPQTVAELRSEVERLNHVEARLFARVQAAEREARHWADEHDKVAADANDWIEQARQYRVEAGDAQAEVARLKAELQRAWYHEERHVNELEFFSDEVKRLRGWALRWKRAAKHLRSELSESEADVAHLAAAAAECRCHGEPVPFEQAVKEMGFPEFAARLASALDDEEEP